MSAKPKNRGNSTGSVYKLPNGTWCAAVTLGYEIMPGGEQKRRTRKKGGFKTKREAQEYIPQLRVTPPGIDPEITFQQLYTEWFKFHSQLRSKDTMNSYAAAYKYYKPVWWCKMRDLKTAALQACLDACPRGRRTQENMKALGTMLYRYAMRDDIVARNYAELLRVGGGKQAPREPFTADELEKMRKAVGTVPKIELVLILAIPASDWRSFSNSATPTWIMTRSSRAIILSAAKRPRRASAASSPSARRSCRMCRAGSSPGISFRRTAAARCSRRNFATSGTTLPWTLRASAGSCRTAAVIPLQRL